MLTFQQLQYFITTVRHGSINKAAKILYISQPALTKQLTRLEEQVKCKLLDRTHRGIIVTDAGRYLYDKANFILDKLEETENHLQYFRPKNIVRIGALPSIANFFLPSFFEQKKIGYTPQISTFDITQMLIHSVEEGKLDLAIVQDANVHLPLHVFHLFTEPYVGVFPIDHPLAQLDSITLTDFTNYPIHMWHDPSDMRQSLRNLCNYYGIEAKFIDVPWNESLLTHVLEYQGVSFIPETVSRHMNISDLAIKTIKPRSFNRKIQVIAKTDKKHMIYEIFSEPNMFDTIPMKQFMHF
ncbi:LysR family transcriptional regulator [Shimazuella kribbensis]|uniref:LysR family transcriptional regulator n=1 Tax=Shimazuella kribbensis TaxID=139808 RepID=UPI0003F537D0|nr:LysR family transcriptional regulator [Shimazuella kribbensis]